jgi:hypothetical protein
MPNDDFRAWLEWMNGQNDAFRQWRERTGMSARLITLGGVERVGPFARLTIQSSGRVPRSSDQAPWLYYASTTYYLMQLDGEWVIVDIDAWIT